LTLLALQFPGMWYTLSEAFFTSNLRHSHHNIFRIVVWLFFLVVYSQAGTLPPHSRGPPDLFPQSVNPFNDWILYIITSKFGKFYYTLWVWPFFWKVCRSSPPPNLVLIHVARSEQGLYRPLLSIVRIFIKSHRSLKLFASQHGAPSRFGILWPLSQTGYYWLPLY
jgi:hypothetical protein